MARFKLELPNDLIKEMKALEQNTEKMLGEMTEAGAEVVINNIRANVPQGIKNEPQIMSKLKLSKQYKTPTDDGINTKVAFYYGEGKKGYFKNRNGQEVPIDLVLKITEYGGKTREYPKRPFLRKSFKKAEIESAMLKVQEKYLPKE